MGLFLEAKSSTQGVREASYACDNERLCGRTGREAGTGDSLRSDRSVNGQWQKLLAEQKRMQAEARAQASDEGVPAYGEVDGKR